MTRNDGCVYRCICLCLCTQTHTCTYTHNVYIYIQKVSFQFLLQRILSYCFISICPYIVLFFILLILHRFSFLLLSEIGHFPMCLFTISYSYKIWITRLCLLPIYLISFIISWSLNIASSVSKGLIMSYSISFCNISMLSLYFLHYESAGGEIWKSLICEKM